MVAPGEIFKLILVLEVEILVQGVYTPHTFPIPHVRLLCSKMVCTEVNCAVVLSYSFTEGSILYCIFFLLSFASKFYDNNVDFLIIHLIYKYSPKLSHLPYFLSRHWGRFKIVLLKKTNIKFTFRNAPKNLGLLSFLSLLIDFLTVHREKYYLS